MNTNIDMSAFNIDCRHCARLAGFLDEVKTKNPAYCCRPVPPFGGVESIWFKNWRL